MSDPTSTAKAVRTGQTMQTRPLSWRLIALIVGDAISFLVFVIVGRTNHGETTGFGAILSIVGTALPFALAWFVVAPFLGAFRSDVTASLSTMLRRTEFAWLCTWPLAVLIRFIVDRFNAVQLEASFLAFAVVVLVTNAVFLGLWRGAFAFITSRMR